MLPRVRGRLIAGAKGALKAWRVAAETLNAMQSEAELKTKVLTLARAPPPPTCTSTLGSHSLHPCPHPYQHQHQTLRSTRALRPTCHLSV
jgi:hypothetical protein